MKLLFINGYISEKDKDEVYSHTKGEFQFAAESLQEKLILGLKKNIGQDFYLLSAPFVNPYPFGYKKMKYCGFDVNENEKYVSFFNMWGIRNFSRKYNLIQKSKDFLDIDDNEKYVLVYSPHVPMLETACYLKQKDPKIKIVLLLPDLPQFISLGKNQNIIYKILKKYDIKKFYEYSAKFDSYILLTKHMNHFVNPNNQKDFLVIEGIADDQFLKSNKIVEKNDDIIDITYTGTLHEKFGIKFLVDAFKKIDKKNYRLNICGAGDSVDYVKKAADIDNRIKYYGQVSYQESLTIQRNSDMLINPRQNDFEFTKYSFPSKNLEYLATGRPVVAYKLDGIPSEYDDVLYYPDDNSERGLINKIIEVANLSILEKELYLKKITLFLEKKNVIYTADKIISFIVRGSK